MFRMENGTILAGEDGTMLIGEDEIYDGHWYVEMEYSA